MSAIKITTPLDKTIVTSLKSGDKVLISGTIYTARDTAHRRLIGLIESGKELPFNIAGQIIYYVGPTPARPGRAVGSAGPTTSYRMDPYAIPLMKLGLKGMIGKGQRSPEIIEAIKKYQCIYFAAVGGAGALISGSIRHSEIIFYEELGPEAIRKMEVSDFPVIVVNDASGNDLYAEGIKQYHRND